MIDLLDFAAHVQEYSENVFYVIGWVAGFNLLNWVFLRGIFNYLGIYPRQLKGLIGIFTAPILHGGLGHLLSNAFPFYWLSLIMIATQGPDLYLELCGLIGFISGLFIWIVARPGIHIGASSLITGMYGWLLALTMAEPTFFNGLMLCILFFYFGFILLGIFPQEDHISWEGHLVGLIAGIIVFIYQHILFFYLYNIAYWASIHGIEMPF